MEEMFREFIKDCVISGCKSPDELSNHLRMVAAYTSDKEKVGSEFFYSVIKTTNFSTAAFLLKKHKDFCNKIIETESGRQSYYELLDNLLYPLYNMKLFYLLINTFGLPEDYNLKNSLCSSAFFAKNLKAYKVIENSMSEEVDLCNIFHLMKNSNPIVVDANSSGHDLLPSSKEMFDHIISAGSDSQLKFLNESFNLESSSLKNFVAEFIIKNIHSWDFLYYINDGMKSVYKEEIAEKVQFLLLHSKQKSRSYIPLIVENSLVDEDSFNYELIYKKNNVCLLKAINPAFFDNLNNIHFYGQLVSFVVNNVKKDKCCYKFIEDFLENGDKSELENRKKIIAKYLATLCVSEVETYEEKMFTKDTYKFFIDNIGDSSFKDKFKEASLLERISLIENYVLNNELDISDMSIRKKRI